MVGEILIQPALPSEVAVGHVSPHVDGEVGGAREVGSAEPLLVTEGEALVPKEVQQEREARVVL